MNRSASNGVCRRIELGYAESGALESVLAERQPTMRRYNEFGELVQEGHVRRFGLGELEALREAFMAMAQVLRVELLGEIQRLGTCARRAWRSSEPLFGEGSYGLRPRPFRFVRCRP